MRKRLAIMGLLLGISIGCNSKNSDTEEQPTSVNTTVENKETTKAEPQTPEQEELKLVGTNTELYAASEEQLLNMLNEMDQKRLQKAIQIVSNHVAETVDIYTAEDDIDFEKWNAIYFKKIDGLTFTGIIQLAEQLLIETKKNTLASLKEELVDLKTNPVEDQEDSLSFLQEELKKAKNLPTTIDTYVYNEECFL